jgi:hypothetical protein
MSHSEIVFTLFVLWMLVAAGAIKHFGRPGPSADTSMPLALVIIGSLLWPITIVLLAIAVLFNLSLDFIHAVEDDNRKGD